MKICLCCCCYCCCLNSRQTRQFWLHKKLVLDVFTSFAAGGFCVTQEIKTWKLLTHTLSTEASLCSLHSCNVAAVVVWYLFFVFCSKIRWVLVSHNQSGRSQIFHLRLGETHKPHEENKSLISWLKPDHYDGRKSQQA